MSKKEKSNKKIFYSQKKSIHQNESGSKTFIDSLYNSNSNEKNKENMNINTYFEINALKSHQKNNNNQKQKNFYLALKTLNSENSQNNNITKTSQNLLSKMSEFSEMNPDNSKDYNISKYLHHPIMKQIIKLGNQIIRKQTGNEYRIYNGLEINKPLVSIYNMKNIFEKFDMSYIGEEISSIKSKLNQKETINAKDMIHQKRSKLKFFHRKNKSSITNYYFNDNNKSYRTMNNCNNINKGKKFTFHFRDNISSLLGGQNKIIFKEKDSATTITKEDYIKDIHSNEFNDINNNLLDNNFNLEVINDFDETNENKVYSTNKKNDELKTTKSINKELIIKNIFRNKENNIKTYNKKYNLTNNKTLRKKYERTEFAMRNKNIHNNNFLMKNLINKFEQCYQNEKNNTLENDSSKNIEINSNNKNNETFIVNEVENNFKLNLEMSENNNSFVENNNIQISEISSNKLSDKTSNYSIKNELKLSSIKSSEENLNMKNRKSYKILNDETKNKKKINKNIYESPKDSDIKKHHFNLNSPFKENNIINNNQIIDLKYNFPFSNKLNNKPNCNEEDIPQSIFDYTFYDRLLKTEEIMFKKYKIISKKELILNTELRLEILIWMMKTCEEFAFKRDTYYNACYYFNMYLTIKSINITNKKEKEKIINLKDKSLLELIGLTCIVISAKLEEIQLPRLKEYAELLNQKYNINSIIEMEKKICSELRWKLIIISKNTWLNWYICQWDLFIDTIDSIKEEFIKVISEDDILYFKKPNDNSYNNFRKITQLIDIMELDFHSYNYEPRILVAISFFIILCNKYNLIYDFTKKKFERNKNPDLSELIFDIYTKFISQSFDFDFNNENLQKGIKYYYNNFINFEFIFDLPLIYQVHPEKLDEDSYEDFLSYQTTNDYFYKTLKEKINITKNKNVKRLCKKIENKKKKCKN